MSGEVHNIRYDDGFILEMRFMGNSFETGSVNFKLFAKNGDSRVNQETPNIPVKSLFDIAYLIDMSIRRTTAQYEKEVQEMKDAIELKRHPFKHVGEKK